MKQITLNNKVIVTDPGLEPSSSMNVTLNYILPGKWNCAVKKKKYGACGEIIENLTIRHENHPKTKLDGFEGLISVYSGQCGFFDVDYFKKNQPDDDYDNPDSWYRKICELTMNKPEWGTIDNMGVVSESGLGDGLYEIHSARDRSGYIVGLRLVFI